MLANTARRLTALVLQASSVEELPTTRRRSHLVSHERALASRSRNVQEHLPYEVLSMIFIHFRGDMDHCVTVSQVCRDWRTAAIHYTPDMWTGFINPPVRQEEWIATLMKRAGTRRLDVELNVRTGRLYAGSPGLLGEILARAWRVRICEEIDEYARSFLLPVHTANVQHWEELVIEGFFENPDDATKSRYSSITAVLPSRRPPGFRLLRVNYPNLHTLSLSHVPVVLSAAGSRYNVVDKLTSLTLTHCDEWPSLDAFARGLAACTELRSLTLFQSLPALYSLSRWMPRSPVVATFPHLETLIVEDRLEGVVWLAHAIDISESVHVSLGLAQDYSDRAPESIQGLLLRLRRPSWLARRFLSTNVLRVTEKAGESVDLTLFTSHTQSEPHSSSSRLYEGISRSGEDTLTHCLTFSFPADGYYDEELLSNFASILTRPTTLHFESDFHGLLHHEIWSNIVPRHMSRLHTLRFTDCRRLEALFSVPDSLPHLRRLVLEDCKLTKASMVGGKWVGNLDDAVRAVVEGREANLPRFSKINSVTMRNCGMGVSDDEYLESDGAQDFDSERSSPSFSHSLFHRFN